MTNCIRTKCYIWSDQFPIRRVFVYVFPLKLHSARVSVESLNFHNIFVTCQYGLAHCVVCVCVLKYSCVGGKSIYRCSLSHDCRDAGGNGLSEVLYSRIPLLVSSCGHKDALETVVNHLDNHKRYHTMCSMLSLTTLLWFQLAFSEPAAACPIIPR